MTLFTARSNGNKTREILTNMDLEGRSVPIRVRRHPRARNLILRVDTKIEGGVVTTPAHVPIREALDLVHSQGRWLLEQLDALPPYVPFEVGYRVPYLGDDHLIRHVPDAPRPVIRDAGEIQVSGHAEHLPRRITDWLRAQARSEIMPRVWEKASFLGCRPGPVTLRDMRTRWGSCAEDYSLSFCWRLIMAPEKVLDYIVAHEVAHFKFLDHSPRFWKLADALTEDAQGSRAWLNLHGDRLYRYG
jgi:hypothetical protein